MVDLKFSDDTPKSNPWTEDKLGYKQFAHRIAMSIMGLEAANGYVIGLQGRWGSGKSTALKFVEAFIGKYNQERGPNENAITVIDFRPWMISGHEDLVESFFKVLAEHLADRKAAWKERGKRTARALKDNVDPLVDAVATVGMVLAPGLGTVGAKIATGAAKHAIGSTLEGWLAKPSLQAAYQELYKKVEERNEKFLVIIDDIDRLNPDEIASIMQMVKTVGRLPNVVYLLAYDRGIVWPALNKINSETSDGPSYAEKIIQQELELPTPSRHSLLKMLDGEIGFLTSGTPQKEHWYYIVSCGIHRWISNPRDVARLANAVKFAWPAVRSDLDPQDLLAIEGIRIFDTKLFNWIRANKDFIFGQGGFSMRSEKAAERTKKEIYSVLPNGKQEEAIRLLCALFPTISSIFDKDDIYGLSKEQHFKIVNRRGVGSPQGYETYFALHPSENAVPLKFVDTALTPTTNVEEQLSILNDVMGRVTEQQQPLIAEFFQDLTYRMYEGKGLTPPISLYYALFEVGEKVQQIDGPDIAFSISPRSQLQFLLRETCRATEQSVKDAVLTEVFNSSSSPSFCAEFWVWRAEELGVIKREGRSDGSVDATIIGKDLLERLHAILMSKMEKAEKNGTLTSSPFYGDILRALSYNNNENVARDWVSGRCYDAKFLATLTKGILAYTPGSNPRNYVLHEKPVEPYLDLDRLLEGCRGAEDDFRLSPDERNRIIALREGLEHVVSSSSAEQAET